MEEHKVYKAAGFEEMYDAGNQMLGLHFLIPNIYDANPNSVLITNFR